MRQIVKKLSSGILIAVITSSKLMTTLFTIGHTNRSIESLLETLKTFNAQRRNTGEIVGNRFPHFCAKPLKASLEAAGIDYEHHEWLGGKGRAVVYDDQWNGTATKEGIEQVLKLIESLKDGRVTVLLCSEGDWRQCHREILADIIVYSGADIAIRHISGRGDRVLRHPVKSDFTHVERPVDAPSRVQSYRGMPRTTKKADKR
ncbi:hypothetical protein FOZ61_000519 [Perkinsus olseni]|uniref:DUF488 domain-containing protein n=1 Tax=Perkinsus olseni TaxID=32597 RepID=A0A7J6MWL7_PEROL|nr:hypothetical protein FOZ61_000519 [Perkinsus olseni]KAF4675824.1 hypothetical protein FOL46_009614 [Perkinsus olseni]